MDVLRGESALAAARTLMGEGLVAVAIDPSARAARGTLEIVALATPARALVIDAQAAKELAALWRCGSAFAAFDAKAVHHVLTRTFGGAPSRWACIKLSATLLAGGRPLTMSLAGIAAQHGLPPPPDAEQGLEAMAAHARALAELVRRQGEELRRQGLALVSRLEAMAVAPIAAMEARGMPFDAPRWQRLTMAAAREREAVAHQAQLWFAERGGAADGPQVALDHDAALRAALAHAGLRVPNTKRATLASLPAPIGGWLARYRSLSKVVTSYGDTFLRAVGRDGRLHASFEQIGASTGRMACHAPNLQAVIRGTEHRGCFSAAPDRRLVVADYSACELRILAEMSQDPVFLRAFAQHQDVHAQVATSIFGEPVSKERNAHLRHTAKTVSFGLAYGMGAAGLAKTLGIAAAAARTLLAQYFRAFPRIRHHLEAAAAEALQRGYAQTLAGRRLYLDVSPYTTDRALAERVAKNMPIQGSNADVIKIALAKVYSAFAGRQDVHLVHCVHDEIVVECPADAAETVRATVVRAMTEAGEALLRQVPLAVDAAICRAWE